MSTTRTNRMKLPLVTVAVAIVGAGCGGGGGGGGPDSSPGPTATATPGVTVSPTSLTVNEGGEATYTIILDSRPEGNVTVTPSSGDSEAVEVSEALTFSTANWNTAQTVTVTGVEENNGDGRDESVTVSHAVTGYGSVTTAAEVLVTVDDNDVQANGIYDSLESIDLAAEEPVARGGLVVLHDGRMIGGSVSLETLTFTFFTGTYTVDGNSFSAVVDGAEVFIFFPSYFEDREYSGTVEEQASLTLVSGDGEAGELSLPYQTIHDRPSFLSMWEGVWVAMDEGVSTATMTVDAGGALFWQDRDGCSANGNLAILDADRNLYGLELTVESCDDRDGAYTGFAYFHGEGDSANSDAILIAATGDGQNFFGFDDTFSRSSGSVTLPESGSGTDDHGNDRSAATRVGVPSETDGEITANDVDYFSIEVTAARTLSVYTSGSIDTVGRLEDDSGSTLASNDDSGDGFNFRIDHDVSAGLYYVRVAGWSSTDTGNYVLNVR